MTIILSLSIVKRRREINQYSNHMILIPYVVLLIAAAIFDLLTLTIPNWLCALLTISFFPVALFAHLPLDAWPGQLSCALTVLGMTFLLFQYGCWGGGDAKLASAIALWLGWSGLPAFLVQTALWGGALAALLLLLRIPPLPSIVARQPFMSRLVDPAAGAPYGVALALGGILTVPHSALWALSGGA